MPNLIRDLRSKYESNFAALNLLEEQNMTFLTDADEIYYYKITRKQLLQETIYSQDLLKFESRFPIGTAETKKKHIEK